MVSLRDDLKGREARPDNAVGATLAVAPTDHLKTDAFFHHFPKGNTFIVNDQLSIYIVKFQVSE